MVSDRYVDSTLAYQGAGRVLETGEVERINRWATDDLRPDLTVLLDLDHTAGLASVGEADRMESAGGDFHARVRDGFLELADRDPARYLVLPARDDRQAIADAVRARVAALVTDPDAAGDGPDVSRRGCWARCSRPEKRRSPRHHGAMSTAPQAGQGSGPISSGRNEPSRRCAGPSRAAGTR